MTKKVVILGGGVAGMSAAHELIERGFQVEVYDRNVKYVGGKARSVDVPNTSEKGKPLPGEHGFRFFPGFYTHVTETMKNIPTENNQSVWNNLVPTKDMMLLQNGKNPVFVPVHFPKETDDWKNLIEMFVYTLYGAVKGAVIDDLKLDEMKFFMNRIWQLMTSCEERFLADYEKISWQKFMTDKVAFKEKYGYEPSFETETKFSDDYIKYCVTGLTRSLVACKADKASLKTVGSIALQLIYLMFRTDAELGTDMVLNAPTNEAWLDPWLAHLKKKGVNYKLGHELTKLNVANGKLESATLSIKNSSNEPIDEITVKGDYYILATPVERAAELLSGNEDIKKLHPKLCKNMDELGGKTEWMNGLMFYLNKKIKLDLYDTEGLNHGHASFADSPWSITSICQDQFWPNFDFSKCHNGEVVDVLSVDISQWDTDGIINYGTIESPKYKKAWECTIEEVKNDCWAQIKREIPKGAFGRELLTDDMLVHWYLDEAIILGNTDKSKTLDNLEPLLVNEVGTWEKRPGVHSDKIPNLLLASDYVQTTTDLASMEAANEAARRAVNKIIELTDPNGKLGINPCTLNKLYEPDTSRPYWDNDRERLAAGLPWDGKRKLSWFSRTVEVLIVIWGAISFKKLWSK